jgi:ankyrin repeat protein
MLAVDAGRLDLVKLLLQNKIALNAQDKWGQSALMIAAGRRDVFAVKLLIEAGASLNLVARNGLTALGYALDNQAKEVAAILKRAGAR